VTGVGEVGLELFGEATMNRSKNKKNKKKKKERYEKKKKNQYIHTYTMVL
jgi:hypothetical protein